MTCLICLCVLLFALRLWAVEKPGPTLQALNGPPQHPNSPETKPLCILWVFELQGFGAYRFHAPNFCRKRIKGAFSQRSFGEAGDCCTGGPSMISHHYVQQTVVLGMLSLSAPETAHQPKKRSFAFAESWSQLDTMTWLARRCLWSLRQNIAAV